MSQATYAPDGTEAYGAQTHKYEVVLLVHGVGSLEFCPS